MIINKQTNKLISKKERICRSIFSQARGLMFRKKQNIIMDLGKEKNISLHMFFVFYPINVLILDKHKRIVEVKQNFKPFTFWKVQQKGRYVVELAHSLSTNHANYKIGDVLKFI